MGSSPLCVVRERITRAELAEPGDALIEFDSTINVRPSQGNPSRDVLDDGIRTRIRAVVSRLVPE
jgi:hypothetical protein